MPLRVQNTPNPNAIKITLDRKLTEGTSRTYSGPAAAADDPLAGRLLAIPGITTVFMLNDFITLTKSADANWNALMGSIEAALAEQS
jgi:hypothetical protein